MSRLTASLRAFKGHGATPGKPHSDASDGRLPNPGFLLEHGFVPARGRHRDRSRLRVGGPRRFFVLAIALGGTVEELLVRIESHEFPRALRNKSFKWASMDLFADSSE